MTAIVIPFPRERAGQPPDRGVNESTNATFSLISFPAPTRAHSTGQELNPAVSAAFSRLPEIPGCPDKGLDRGKILLEIHSGTAQPEEIAGRLGISVESLSGWLTECLGYLYRHR